MLAFIKENKNLGLKENINYMNCIIESLIALQENYDDLEDYEFLNYCLCAYDIRIRNNDFIELVKLILKSKAVTRKKLITFKNVRLYRYYFKGHVFCASDFKLPKEESYCIAHVQELINSRKIVIEDMEIFTGDSDSYKNHPFKGISTSSLEEIGEEYGVELVTLIKRNITKEKIAADLLALINSVKSQIEELKSSIETEILDYYDKAYAFMESASQGVDEYEHYNNIALSLAKKLKEEK